jgi:MoxR-like ATPase
MGVNPFESANPFENDGRFPATGPASSATATQEALTGADAVRADPLGHLGGVLRAAQQEVAKAIVGEDHTVELIMIALLSRSHVLLDGPPGTGKTLLAQAVSRLLGARFRRIQFTPDTSPAELTGHVGERAGEKVFERGALFTNVLLVDEINRTPPRTQAALLEAMQERTVTVLGETHRLESPFFVIATQNPYEQKGVFVLPESQLDRFLFRIHLDYGSEEDELAMLDLPRRGVSPDVISDVTPLLGERGVLLVQDAADAVDVPEDAARAAVAVVRQTREAPDVVLGGGPRATIHVLVAAKARALLNGRSTVAVDDVWEIAREALPHRILGEADQRDVTERAIEAAMRLVV